MTSTISGSSMHPFWSMSYSLNAILSLSSGLLLRVMFIACNKTIYTCSTCGTYLYLGPFISPPHVTMLHVDKATARGLVIAANQHMYILYVWKCLGEPSVYPGWESWLGLRGSMLEVSGSNPSCWHVAKEKVLQLTTLWVQPEVERSAIRCC